MSLAMFTVIIWSVQWDDKHKLMYTLLLWRATLGGLTSLRVRRNGIDYSFQSYRMITVSYDKWWQTWCSFCNSCLYHRWFFYLHHRASIIKQGINAIGWTLWQESAKSNRKCTHYDWVLKIYGCPSDQRRMLLVRYDNVNMYIYVFKVCFQKHWTK